MSTSGRLTHLLYERNDFVSVQIYSHIFHNLKFSQNLLVSCLCKSEAFPCHIKKRAETEFRGAKISQNVHEYGYVFCIPFVLIDIC
jgi:hypothetical protein